MNDAATMLDPQRLPNGDVVEELAAAARKSRVVGCRVPAARRTAGFPSACSAAATIC